MKPILVGIFSAIALGFGVGEGVNFIDWHCFYDLAADNLGYGFLEILRFVPLFGESITTGTMLAFLMAKNQSAAGLLGVKSGSIFTLILFSMSYFDFTQVSPGHTFAQKAQYAFFEWGEYTIWAVMILISGILILARRRNLKSDSLMP